MRASGEKSEEEREEEIIEQGKWEAGLAATVTPIELLRDTIELDGVKGGRTPDLFEAFLSKYFSKLF